MILLNGFNPLLGSKKKKGGSTFTKVFVITIGGALFVLTIALTLRAIQTEPDPYYTVYPRGGTPPPCDDLENDNAPAYLRLREIDQEILRWQNLQRTAATDLEKAEAESLRAKIQAELIWFCNNCRESMQNYYWNDPCNRLDQGHHDILLEHLVTGPPAYINRDTMSGD